jgi:hypothetical protein
MDIPRFLTEVMAECMATDHRYTALRRPGLRAYPIPFFGRIETATVLTVGVNPSPGEFEDGRWPLDANAHYVSERLLRYFEKGQLTHPWFDAWRDALRQLDISYESGDAAHVDISPRATIPMGQVSEIDLFLKMVRADTKWLFRLLASLERPRLLLIAGCVTKKLYMVRFLRECAPSYGFLVLGKEQESGSGRVGYHAFESSGRQIPAFFCSVSPSERNAARCLLVDRIQAHAPRLSMVIRGEHPGWTSNRRMQLTALRAAADA